MMYLARYWALAAMCVLGASASGCAIEPEEGHDGEIVADTDEAARTVDPGPITISNGSCARDGIVLRDGKKFRLKMLVGDDVSGISKPTRGGLGDVCHNKSVWATACTYACAMNGVGTFSGDIPEFTEFFRGRPIDHPAFSTDDGLFFGHAELSGPCTGRRTDNDFLLDHIECCQTEPRKL